MVSDFFSNRELYNIIEEVKKEMIELKSEMKETRTIIRDYNGLRKKVDEVDEKTDKVDIRVNTLMWIIGIAIPGLGLLFTFLNYMGR